MKKSGDKKKETTPGTNILRKKNISGRIRPAVKKVSHTKTGINTKVPGSEQSVIESEKRFRALVENGNDGIAILSAEGRVTYITPSVKKILGYSEEEIAAINLFSLLHPDDTDEIQKIFEKVLVSPGIPIAGDSSRVKHKDGTWRWLEATITNMLHDPSIRGIVDNFRDVTEKVTTEKTLAANEKRFRALVENGNDAFVILNKTGTAIYASSSVERVLGYTEKETLSINMFDILHADHINDIQKALYECLANPGTAVSKPVAKWLHKDGTLRWLEGTITNMLHEPAIGGIVDNFRDVTEKVQIEKKVREERMLFRTLIDNLPLNVYTKDLQSRKTLVNRVDYEYAGFTSEEGSIGKTDFDLFSEESARNTIEEDKYIFTTGESIISKEEHHIKKDGSDSWFLISKIPLKNEERKITGLLGISFDISERKKTEEALSENKLSLQKAFDIAVIGSWKYDLKKDRFEWAQKAIDVVGFKEKTIPYTWDDYLKFIPADDLEQFMLYLKKAVGSGVFDQEHRLDVYGKIKWVRVKAHLEYDKKGSPVTSTGIIQDITERKLIEQRLTDAYNFNQTIIETSPIGIWIYDESGQTISANRAAEELSGANAEKLLSMNFKDILSWKAAGLYDAATAALESGNPVKKEIHFINTFNKELWFEALLTPVQFKGKKHLILMTYDIHDRMKAEKSLIQSEKQLSIAIQIARLGYWEFDVMEGLFTFNDQFYSMLKTTAGKAGGYRLPPQQYAEMFVYSEDQALVGAEVAKAITTTDPDFSRQIEHRVIFGNGEIGHVSVNFYIIKDNNGNTIKTYGVNQDITERKKAEEEIKLAKERYELVARATNDAIYEWDIVNNINYWGQGYETLFGHKRTGDKMHTDSWVLNLHPDEKEKHFAKVYEAFEKKTQLLTREMRFKCADGSYKTVFDKLIILYDNDLQPLKIVGAMQDITEQKEHETAIEKLNEQLNTRAEELAESNAELERFAYIASHDLQEPLRMVGSFLQLLQKKYNAQLDETANQYIGFAVDGAERMKRLIFDLLEYSRVGSNRDTLSHTNVGEEINNNVLGIFESKIRETNAVLKIQPMPVIKANKTQIVQLFQNLIGNALKYNNSPVPEIEIGCKEKNNAWEFYIKDNGIGIDNKFFTKIFVIFQRLHNRKQFSGTGVGLAICKKIVEKHGGTIWIESAEGMGSTFFFTIKK